MAVKSMSEDYGFYASSQKLCCKYLHENFLSNIFEDKINQITMLGCMDKDDGCGTKTLTVADYGAADVKNSVEIYQDVAERIYQHCKSDTGEENPGSKLHLVLKIQDLPRNKWNAVKDNCNIYLALKYDKILSENLMNYNRDSIDQVTEFGL